jgi:hypothetical protein
MSDATPQQYRHTFELTNDGQAVLDDLIDRFGKPPFVAGQSDTTAYNCGCKAVIEHIWSQLAAVEPQGGQR